MAPPPPELLDDLIEEILLRFPPDDPARLVRVALVCKRWCRLISLRRFRRRYAELHRMPPMLGFFYFHGVSLSFKSTTSFRLLRCGYSCRALDARHGRVLLHDWSVLRNSYPFLFRKIRDSSLFHEPSLHVPCLSCIWCRLARPELIVWDPTWISTETLRGPQIQNCYTSWRAAVLCSWPGCDHLDCSGGICFSVAFVATDWSESFTSAWVYSSESRKWSNLTSVEHVRDRIDSTPNVLVGNTLHFLFERGIGILKLDVGTQEISVIELPFDSASYSGRLLITLEDGSLGLATISQSKIFLWSREAGPGPCRRASWIHHKVIDLEASLSIRALSASPQVVGFADVNRVIFLHTVDGLFTIDVKSNLVKKIEEEGLSLVNIVPYFSFYTPVLLIYRTNSW